MTQKRFQIEESQDRNAAERKGTMKITALIENKSENELLHEHGLSIHIEYQNENYLLDTGASNAFAENAEKLNIKLADVDAAILSHSHFDHSNGFEEFFSKNQKAKVYLQKEAQEECYAKVLCFKSYIGMPKGLIEQYPNRFYFLEKNKEIAPGVWLIRHSTKGLALKAKKDHFYRKVQNRLVPDDLLHEQSLVFKGIDGLVILNSCCHAGVDHIIEEVKAVFPNQEIAALIGGFHLMGLRGPSSKALSKDKIYNLGERVLELGVHKVYTCHCTGDPAFHILKECMKERLDYFKTGDEIEIL